MTETFIPTEDMMNFLDDLFQKPQINMYSETMLLVGEFPGLSFQQAQEAVDYWKEKREYDEP